MPEGSSRDTWGNKQLPQPLQREGMPPPHDPKAMYIYQTKAERTFVSKFGMLPNEFIENCLMSTHGEYEQTNHHTVIGAEQTSFDIRSITNIRGNATEYERRHLPSLVRFCYTVHKYPF